MCFFQLSEPEEQIEDTLLEVSFASSNQVSDIEESVKVPRGIDLVSDYVVTPKPVEEAELRDPSELKLICSRNCDRECFKAVDTIDRCDIDDLQKSLKHRSVVVTKNQVLSYLKVTYLTRDSLDFYFANFVFCVKAFSFLSGVSEYVLCNVKADLAAGRNIEYGITKSERYTAKKTNFKAWVLAFSGVYGQYSPTKPMIILPKIWTRKCLFDLYNRECIRPIYNMSMFYKSFKDLFGSRRKDKNNPHIRISKYSTHSKCDDCVKLEKERSNIKTKEDKNIVNKKVEAHRRVFGGAREVIAEKLQHCVSFPKDCLGISMDDMDQHKSNLPHVVEPGKKLSKLFKLDTKITGVILTSGLYEKNRKVRFHYNHGQFEQGSNKVVSMLYKNILDFSKEHKFLPPKLFLNLDNCWRENKNQFLLAFLYFLVEIGVFEEVEFMLLIVGHTGNHVDQLFSILAQMFKCREIRTIEDLVCLMENSVINPKPEVEELEYIWDWKATVTPHLTGHMTNQSIPHAFQFKNEEGVTKFRSKLLPQDVKYREEAGMKILRHEAKNCIKLVDSANFKIEDLSLDEVGRDYCNKFVTSLSEDCVKRFCLQSWDRLRSKLEKLPRRQKNLPKMNFLTIPKHNVTNIEEFDFDEEDEAPEIGGIEVYAEDLGSLKVGDDVAIYTVNKEGRPWVARVTNLISSEECEVQWFEKKSALLVFKPMNMTNSSPYLQNIQRRSIMFINISAKYRGGEIRLTPHWRTKIMEEYARLDSIL